MESAADAPDDAGLGTYRPPAEAWVQAAWIDPGDIHEDRWQSRGGWGDGGRVDERSADVARGAAYHFPKEVVHAGRWERRAEWAHDRTAARDEAWRVHKRAVAAAQAEACPYERVPKFVDAGAAGNPYRHKPVEFVGFDGVMEPVRMPFRARGPTGRRETEVTRPDRAPTEKQKATLMHTAAKLSTAALEADRRLTAMEDPSEAAAAAAKKLRLRQGGQLNETAAARVYHRRASDLTDKRVAAAAAPPKTKMEDFFGGNFGEGDVVTPGDIAAAIPGYYRRRGSDLTAASSPGQSKVGAGVATCMGWTDTQTDRRNPGKGRSGIETKLAAAGGGGAGAGVRAAGLGTARGHDKYGAASWDVFIHQPQAPPRKGTEPRVFHKFVAGGRINEVVRWGPDMVSDSYDDDDGEEEDAASAAEIPNLMNTTRRREWRKKLVAQKERALAAIDEKRSLNRTTRVHSDWKAPLASATSTTTRTATKVGTLTDTKAGGKAGTSAVGAASSRASAQTRASSAAAGASHRTGAAK